MPKRKEPLRNFAKSEDILKIIENLQQDKNNRQTEQEERERQIKAAIESSSHFSHLWNFARDIRKSRRHGARDPFFGIVNKGWKEETDKRCPLPDRPPIFLAEDIQPFDSKTGEYTVREVGKLKIMGYRFSFELYSGGKLLGLASLSDPSGAVIAEIIPLGDKAIEAFAVRLMTRHESQLNRPIRDIYWTDSKYDIAEYLFYRGFYLERK